MTMDMQILNAELQKLSMQTAKVYLVFMVAMAVVLVIRTLNEKGYFYRGKH